LKGEKSQKIRTLPTRPLHAVLDEPFAIGIAFLIIVLNHGAARSIWQDRKQLGELREPKRLGKGTKTTNGQSPPAPRTGKVKKREINQRQISMNGILEARKQV